MNVEFAREIVKEYKGSLLKDLIGVYKKPIYGSIKKLGYKHKIYSYTIGNLFSNLFWVKYHDRRCQVIRKRSFKIKTKRSKLVKKYGKNILKDLAKMYKDPYYKISYIQNNYKLSFGTVNYQFKKCFDVTFYDRHRLKKYRGKFCHKLVKLYGKDILKDLGLLFKDESLNQTSVANKYGITAEYVRQIFHKLYKTASYTEVRKKVLFENNRGVLFLELFNKRVRLINILKRRVKYLKVTFEDDLGNRYKRMLFNHLTVKHLTIDEKPKRGRNGLLMVLCTYCGRYFYPEEKDVLNRAMILNRKSGGEARLYCSDGCKQACPTFYQQLYPRGFKEETSREVQPELRQMRLEIDNYTCQKCGKTIDEIQLHCHHITGVEQNPIESADLDNTITLCKDCHNWVHSQKGCTRYDFRC